MDQTSLSFVMDGRTYEKTGADKVQIASSQSSHEKRQCAVQLTILANGSVLTLLLIFLWQKVTDKSGREKPIGAKSEDHLSTKGIV